MPRWINRLKLLYVVYLVITLAASLLLLLSRPALQPAPRPALLPAQSPIITANSEKNTRKLFAAQFIGAKANNKTNKDITFMKKKNPPKPPKQIVKTLTSSKNVHEPGNRKPVGLQPVVKCPKPAETAEKTVQTCRGEISLVSPPGRITALASFPGSGNTWTRHLIQQVLTSLMSIHCKSLKCCLVFSRFLCNVRIAQVTGRATGSVYRDSKLACGGFPGESRRDGTVAVVKVHEGGPRVRAQYQAAVLLLRDPVQAALAEFNRQAGGHTGYAKVRSMLLYSKILLSLWPPPNLQASLYK